MSVPVTDPIDQYVVVGGETTFTYSWLINSESEIVVQKQDNSVSPGVITTLTLTTDYTVQNAGTKGGGTITPVGAQSPVVIGDVWTLFRDSTINRPQDFAVSGGFQAVTVNQQLDNLTRIAQDQERDIDEAVKKDPGVGDSLNPLIPQMVSGRALKLAESSPNNFVFVMSETDPDDGSVKTVAGLFATVLTTPSNIVVQESQDGFEVRVDTSAGDVDITLPDSTSLTSDFRVAIVKTTSDSNVVNGKVQGSDTANGGTSDIVQAVQFERLIYTLDQASASYVVSLPTASTDLSSPPPIGDVTPNTGEFTSLEATSLIGNIVASGNIQTDAVAQSELKTTTGQVSTTTAAALLTLAGGEFGFWITVKHTDNASNRFLASPLNPDNSTGGAFSTAIGTTLVNRLVLGSSSGLTVTAQQRFIQASPPYNLGDGDCHSFIFLVVNSKGEVESSYHAADPPWANNGPTCIRPEWVSKGKKYRNRCVVDLAKGFEDPERYSLRKQEITMAFKNSDMALLPHPFQGNDLTGKTIVLIDPCDPIVLRAEEMKNAGENAANELFFKKYVTIGNEHLSGRKTPSSEVMVVKPTWKNTN